MNLKRITQKLGLIRDNRKKNGELSEEDIQLLRSLLGDTITIAQDDLSTLPSHHIENYKPVAHNDNSCLTTEQKFRLRLIEKTGRGSLSIH